MTAQADTKLANIPDATTACERPCVTHLDQQSAAAIPAKAPSQGTEAANNEYDGSTSTSDGVVDPLPVTTSGTTTPSGSERTKSRKPAKAPRLLAVPPHTPGRQLVPVSLSGLMDAPPEKTQYVVEPLIPRAAVTLCSAHGGTGKTTFSLVLVAHMAAGRDLASLKIRKGVSVVVSLEEPGHVLRSRLRAIIQAYNLPADEVLANVRIFDGSHGDAELMVEESIGGVRRLVDTPAMRELDALCDGADCIVIDNSSDAYGGDENDRRQVRAFLRRLKQTAAEVNAALLLLAHVDKQGARYGTTGNSYSGSTAWHNSARSRFALTSRDDGTIALVQEKLNGGKKSDEILFYFNDDGVLVPLARQGAALRDAQAQEDAIGVYDVLKSLIGQGEVVSTSEAGPSQAIHAVRRHLTCPAFVNGPGGRKRFYAAIAMLREQGKLRRETYTKPNRHLAEKWVLT